ncbi:MAG: DsbA family protein [Gemmatimonadaceae bacterium]
MTNPQTHLRRAALALVLSLVAACERTAADKPPAADTAAVTPAALPPAPPPLPQQLPGTSSEPVRDSVVARPGKTPPAPASPAAATSPRVAPPQGTPGPRRIVVHGVDLTGVGYDQGSPTAPLVLVNFSDFGCPFCARFSLETYPTIEREYVRTGKVFFKYVPFVMGMFPNGAQAARAAECAAEQGRFWPMHDRLYADQRGWKGTRAPYEVFQGAARAIGLEPGRFDACYAKDETHPRTRQANAAAEALGVRVTPSFLVGDRGVEGALPLAQFRVLLDAALRETPSP